MDIDEAVDLLSDAISELRWCQRSSPPEDRKAYLISKAQTLIINALDKLDAPHPSEGG